jgi:hypothetical protein
VPPFLFQPASGPMWSELFPSPGSGCHPAWAVGGMRRAACGGRRILARGGTGDPTRSCRSPAPGMFLVMVCRCLAVDEAESPDLARAVALVPAAAKAPAAARAAAVPRTRGLDDPAAARLAGPRWCGAGVPPAPAGRVASGARGPQALSTGAGAPHAPNARAAPRAAAPAAGATGAGGSTDAVLAESPCSRLRGWVPPGLGSGLGATRPGRRAGCHPAWAARWVSRPVAHGSTPAVGQQPARTGSA